MAPDDPETSLLGELSWVPEDWEPVERLRTAEQDARERLRRLRSEFEGGAREPGLMLAGVLAVATTLVRARRVWASGEVSGVLAEAFAQVQSLATPAVVPRAVHMVEALAAQACLAWAGTDSPDRFRQVDAQVGLSARALFTSRLAIPVPRDSGVELGELAFWYVRAYRA